jgi:hypothetical protein
MPLASGTPFILRRVTRRRKGRLTMGWRDEERQRLRPNVRPDEGRCMDYTKRFTTGHFLRHSILGDGANG